MKKLILCAIASLFLFTSCFEKEEEVTVIPVEEIEEAPIEEGNVMECEMVIKFIEDINSYPIPQEGSDRASIEKYNYKGKTTYYISPTGNYWTDDAGAIIDSNCNMFCTNSQIPEENTCLDWWENAVFVEDIWRDNR